MNKKLIAIAVAAAFAAPMAAQAEATVFGKVHVSVGTIEDTPAGSTTPTDDNFQVNSHASRLGFKGSHDLGGDMKAKYHLEWGVNPDSGGTGGDGLSRRNQWAGLAGGWGEIRVGRHDTPLKMAQGKFDQFNDTNADISGKLGISQGEIRADNVVAYINKFGGLTLGVALIPSEGDGKTEGTGNGIGAGDGIADTTSIALMYSAGPLYVSIAQDTYDDTGNDTTDVTDDLTRAIVTYKMGTMQLGLLYETGGGASETARTKANDKDVLGVSFGMGIGGANKIKLQYMTAEDAQSGTAQVEETQTTIGFNHKFNKQTTGYIMYTDGEDGDGTQSKREFTHLALGMIVNF